MKTANQLCLGLSLLLAATGCSNEVFFSGGGTGGSGSNSSNNSNSSNSNSSNSSNSNSSNGVTTSSGGGACVVGSERFEMKLKTHDGEVWGCGGDFSGPTGTIGFRGTVVASNPTGFSADLCPPAADCQGYQFNHVRYGVDEIHPVVPVGSLVDVTVSIDQPWGCSQAISVVNVPVWQGLPNPVSSEELVWLAAADGTTSVLHSSIGVHTVEQNCVAEDVGCGDFSKAFNLRFASSDAYEVLTLVPGEEAIWEFKNQVLSVKALRAFESGCLDDYWDWGYIITQVPTDS